VRVSLCCSLILMTLTTAGCHTMHPVAFDQVSAERPKQVWVTKADQSVVVLAGPQIVNNRLTGFVGDVYQVFSPEDVQQVGMRRPAAARTAALVATGTIAAVSFLAVTAGSGDYVHPCTRDTAKCDPSEVP
jgi:hypothetical protein